MYCVTSKNGGTLTDSTGTLNETVEPGKQVHVTAPSDLLLIDDDEALMRSVNFKHAPLVLGKQGGGSSTLPAGAVAVDYLESSGTQYIKTGYFGNQDTGLRSVHQQVTAGNFRVAGTRDPRNENLSVLAVHHRNSAVGTAYGYAAWTNYGGVTTGWSEKFTGTTNYLNKQRAGTLLVGDSVNSQAGHDMWGKTFSCTYELWLFAFNQGGSPTNAFKGKIFEFQISQGDAIVRDYRPYVSRDGKPFMFDIATGRVLENAGTGAFRIGLSSETQVRAVLNNLPDLNGAAEPGELLVRLADDISTDAVRELMNNIGNAKNWSIVEP